MAENHAPIDSRDEALEQALREVLHPTVSADSLAQLRKVAEFEWRRAAAEGRRRIAWRNIGLGAAAASVLLVGGWLASSWFLAPDTIGVIQRNASVGLVVDNRWAGSTTLTAGSALQTNRRVHADATSVVALRGGGQLMLKSGTTIETTEAHEIRLIVGAVYIDLDPMVPHDALGVRTKYGLVKHVGTQFEVTQSDSEKAIRVREGSATLSGPVDATVQAGEEITLDSNGTVARRKMSSDDPAWKWVNDAPSSYELEGQTLTQFLRWVARETGQQLDFADERAQQLAEGTILHGSVRELSAIDALQEVLATTSLSAEVREGRIRVSVTPPLPTPMQPPRSP
jgi:ferric-dicitrate binding protein FerR (iron transport regulator)